MSRDIGMVNGTEEILSKGKEKRDSAERRASAYLLKEESPRLTVQKTWRM